MKKEIVGIVVEFNPLHNGHKHLIDTVRDENPDCILVAAMSGQFVQRGELAIFDKWTRAEAAIEFGVDIVIEIPPFFVLNNANIFANKSMEIFNKAGVSKVYFGTENLSIDEIFPIASKLIDEQEKLKELNKIHHSLPKAFEEFVGKKLDPNDTLGICYITESIKSGYKFDFNRVVRESGGKWSSASRIRNDIWNDIPNDKSLITNSNIRSLDDYTELILGKLVTADSELDVIKYLSNIAVNKKIKSISELINESHNSSFTKSKLRRELVKFTLELEGSDELIILASNNSGKDILRDLEEYKFRHSKNNNDNYKVERFLSIKNNSTVELELSKKTIFK